MSCLVTADDISHLDSNDISDVSNHALRISIMEINTHPLGSNSANGLGTANIVVKVSEGQLYLVDHNCDPKY
jgi:hypothetical protein